jgi:IS30 family transposase
MAMERRGQAKKRFGAGTWALVEKLIRKGWGLEQISERLRKDHNLRISHEWIYQHIMADECAGGDMYRHLRCQKERRKRYGSYDRRGELPERTSSIEEKPEIVEKRQRLVDLEVDTILGKGRRRLLVTLTDH